MSKNSFRGIVYISAMPWQERGFMLYTNEEPLVQRTCIKTANLQSDTNTSDKLETQELPPEGLRPKSLPPEELKLQTLFVAIRS